MAKIDKITMGRKAKRAFFNMSHQVNTTLSYGFAEPTMCLDVIPDTKLDVQAYTGVRLAPLPQPTTGKIALKQFYSYVKTKDVFEAFDNLQSQTSVGSSRGSYVPWSADTVNNQAFMLALIIQCGKFLSSAMSGTDVDFNARQIASQLFRFSFNSTIDIYGRSLTDVHNIWEDVRRAYDADNTTTATHVLEAFYHNIYDNRAKLARQLGSCLGFTGETMDYNNWLNWLQFSNFDAELKAFFDTNGVPSGETALNDYKRFLDGIALADTFVFDKNLTFENADFYFELNDSNRPTMYIGDANGFYVYEDSTDYHTYIGVHLTPAGKRLFKILNCIGVNFGYKENIELPKLYAYYKAYFDIFNPGRNLQWKDTNCYKIIHSFYDSPDWNVTAWSRYLMFGTAESLVVSQDYLDAVSNFFVDLVQCFYTEKVDPITVATVSPVLFTNEGESSGGSNTLDGFTIFKNEGYTDEKSIQDGYSYGDNAISVRFLQSLYNWVNKNTVIGQRVAQYMAEHFGVSIPTTSFIDKDSFDIDIIDSIATVNNEQTALGEYAGLGKGRANGERHKFTAPDFGYFFQFTIVVPNGGYVQTGTKAKVRRFDWFQPQFDSVGMAPISMYEVQSRNSYMNSFEFINPTFGFRPRYFEQKYKNNLANGGFSFRSDRAKFLGYSLDKLFSEPELYRAETNLEPSILSSLRNNTKLMEYKGVTLRPDEELRYIGKDESFGNYDRIFYDTTGHTDNFIAYIDNSVKMYANMKPISDSFEAYDETQDTDTLDVSHS